MKHLFMLDIETTGLDMKKSEVIQICLVELKPFGKFYKEGKHLNLYFNPKSKKMSEFAKQHQADLYAACHLFGETLNTARVREQIKQFFLVCGSKPKDTYIVGRNAANFDVPFLYWRDILIPLHPARDSKGKDIGMVGDCHYRIWDITTLQFMAMKKLDIRSMRIMEKHALKWNPIQSKTNLKKPTHDALDDCRFQLDYFNGLIYLL